MLGNLQQLEALDFAFSSLAGDDDLASYLSMSLVVVRGPRLGRALHRGCRAGSATHTQLVCQPCKKPCECPTKP